MVHVGTATLASYRGQRLHVRLVDGPLRGFLIECAAGADLAEGELVRILAGIATPAL